MLHCVYGLVANLVCLLFGAEQAVYSGFVRAFLWTQLPTAAGNKDDEVKSETLIMTVKLWAVKQNKKKKAEYLLRCSTELRGTAESRDAAMILTCFTSHICPLLM